VIFKRHSVDTIINDTTIIPPLSRAFRHLLCIPWKPVRHSLAGHPSVGPGKVLRGYLRDLIVVFTLHRLGPLVDEKESLPKIIRIKNL
jgi:hypothetical protein